MIVMRSSTLRVDGGKLRTARELAGYTQQEIAQKLRIDRSAVAHWESGRQQPSAVSFKALCKRYKTTADELLAGSDDRAE